MEKTFLQKYEPKSFDDLILPNEIIELLKSKTIQKGYRLLLHGSPGSGKTTTSKILTNNHQRLYLSGSNDFNIDVMREKVYGFCSGANIEGKQKTIIIDEAENIRDNLQDAFKVILDKSSTNFIFITNEYEKMNPAIQSRCSCIDYDFSGENLKEQKKNYALFIKKICQLENIEFDNNGLIALRDLNFPDFRHLLIHLQDIKTKDKRISIENVKSLNESGKQLTDLYEVILDNTISVEKTWQFLNQFKGKEKDALLSLGEPFFQYLNERELYQKTLLCAMTVSKYSTDYTVTINKFVAFIACINELKSHFK